MSLPAVGTKVLVNGNVRYVAGYTHGDINTYGSPTSSERAREHAEACRKYNKIVHSRESGNYHGNFAFDGEWKVMDNPLESLSDEDKNAISRLALDKASELGYCDETRRVLEAVGLPGRPPKAIRTITVELDILEEEGRTLSVDNITNLRTPGVKIVAAREV